MINANFYSNQMAPVRYSKGFIHIKINSKLLLVRKEFENRSVWFIILSSFLFTTSRLSSFHFHLRFQKDDAKLSIVFAFSTSDGSLAPIFSNTSLLMFRVCRFLCHLSFSFPDNRRLRTSFYRDTFFESPLENLF